MTKFCFIIFCALLVFSCKKNHEIPPLSACMQAQIDSSLAKPKGYAYYRIDAYTYHGENVYLYYQGCCDRYNDLQDKNCKYIFSPSGGFAGGGDGTHPDFRTDAVFISTLWVDPRP